MLKDPILKILEVSLPTPFFIVNLLMDNFFELFDVPTTSSKFE